MSFFLCERFQRWCGSKDLSPQVATKVEYGHDGEIIKSNYIGALYVGCDNSINIKNVTLPAFAHNANRYDKKFIIHGIKGKFKSKKN